MSAVQGEWAVAQEGWGRLLVKWGAATASDFDACKAAFRARFPMATWDRTAAAWSVPASLRAQLAAFLAAHFAVVDWPERRPTAPAPSGLEGAYKVLHLRSTAPTPLVRAARRVLATEVHPDVAGDTGARMAEINAAADKILHATGRT